MSFETEAKLSLTVDEGDLRAVRQQIEDGIGTTAVGVADGGSMSAQSAGAGGGGRRGRRATRLAETRTDHLEDIALYLESIDDAVSEGGLGGGAGGLLTEVFGVFGETAGDVAVETGDTVADAVSDVMTGAVASSIGNAVGSAVSDSTVGVEPNPLPVEGGGSGGGVTVSPTFNPTFSPDVGTDINLPDLDLGVPDTLAVDRDPLPVEDVAPLAVEETTLPVEDVGPIPVEDVGPIGVEFSAGGSASQPTGEGPRTGGELLKDALGRGASGVVAGAVLGSISPDPFTTGAGAIGGGLTGIGSTLVGEAGRRLGSNSGSAGGSPAPANLTAEVTHSPTYTVEIDPRRLDSLAERIVNEVESGVEDDIDALEGEVEELEAELDDLERQIRRGR